MDPYNAGILEAQVHSYMALNQVKAVQILKRLIEDDPQRPEAYIEYWRVMKDLKNALEMKETQAKFCALCEST